MVRPRALVIARDRELLSDLDRVAAVAGCEVDLADCASRGRRFWSTAPLVLLDVGVLDECAGAGLSRRPGVLVLCRGEPSAGLWRQAVGVGAETVLALPESETALVNALSDIMEGGDRRGRVLAVVGGRGGAGASSFAAAAALVAQRRGHRALLIDCDPLGGGLDFLLGAEQVDGLRWPELPLAGGRVAAAALHDALPSVPVARSGSPGRRGTDGRAADLPTGWDTRPGSSTGPDGRSAGMGGRPPLTADGRVVGRAMGVDASASEALLGTGGRAADPSSGVYGTGLVRASAFGGLGGDRLTVLSCGRDGHSPAPEAVAAVIDAGRRAGDTVVCDLPRHLPEAAVVALDRADLVVLVVPAEVRACAAATPLAEQLRQRGSTVRLVVRGPAPGGLLPADVSRVLALPLLASMRPAPGLAAALDAGRLLFRTMRNPLARAAGLVLDVLVEDTTA